MKTNMGKIDRILRFLVGIVLVAMVFLGPQTPWGWVGIVPLVTALLGWCPLYVPFGFSTYSRDRSAS